MAAIHRWYKLFQRCRLLRGSKLYAGKSEHDYLLSARGELRDGVRLYQYLRHYGWQEGEYSGFEFHPCAGYYAAGYYRHGYRQWADRSQRCKAGDPIF